MTNVNKTEIKKKITQEISKLGSSANVASKCNVPTRIISQMITGGWEDITDEMWQCVDLALSGPVKTSVNKTEIKRKILLEISKLGSAAKVATKCNISTGTISQMVTENWEHISDAMWQSVEIALSGHVKDENWLLVTDTYNYRIVHQVVMDAKKHSIFIPITENAGAGKTAALTSLAKEDGVYYIECRDWGKRDFLTHLCRKLGIQTRGKQSPDSLTDEILRFFLQRKLEKPVLIIDQANDLSSTAIRFLIPLFNACEGMLGCVLSACDSFETEINNGMRLSKKGYDEIHSRLGSSYVHLFGYTKEDVKSICEANGVKEASLINRFWKQCNPVDKIIDNQSLKVITDMRRIKRLVQTELMNREDARKESEKKESGKKETLSTSTATA